MITPSDRTGADLSELKIHRSNGKTFLIFLGSIVLVLASLGLLLHPETMGDSHNSARNTLLGGVGLLLFGLCSIVILFSFWNKKPAVILNSRGLTIDQPGSRNEFLPWTDIAGVSTLKIKGQRFIGLQLESLDQYMENCGAMKKVARKANYKMYGSPVFVHTNVLTLGHEEILQRMQGFIDKYNTPETSGPASGYPASGGAL